MYIGVNFGVSLEGCTGAYVGAYWGIYQGKNWVYLGVYAVRFMLECILGIYIGIL